MSRIIEVAINPSDQNQDLVISQKIAEILDLPLAQLPYFRILKKSLDARKAPMYSVSNRLFWTGERLSKTGDGTSASFSNFIPFHRIQTIVMVKVVQAPTQMANFIPGLSREGISIKY